jgi:hypothetical protein
VLYGFFISGYKEKYFYWETLGYLKKAILIIGVTYLENVSVLVQVLFVLLFLGIAFIA